MFGMFFIFLVIIISKHSLYFKFSLCLWCLWCLWCLMYRYIQTLTLKRHPALSWCPFPFYAPSWAMVFYGFLHSLPLFAAFCRVKYLSFSSRESAEKKAGSRHSTPKTYSKRPRTSPFSHSPGKQALYFAFYGVFRAWVV